MVSLQIPGSTPVAWALRHMVVLAVVFALSACGSGSESQGPTCYGGVASGGQCIPTATVSAPAGNLSGSVTLTATVSVDYGVTVSSVEFRVDGAAIATATTAPYSISWNTATVSDGTHQLTVFVTDSENRTASSPILSVTVANAGVVAVTLAPGEVYPVPASSATATGSFTFNVASGTVSGAVTLSGVANPTAVQIGDAYAGDSGPVVLNLTQNATTPAEWDVPAGTTLTPAQMDELPAGRLYVLAESTAFPQGELRGQIAPANISVLFAAMSGAQEVPPVSTSGSGVAAVTVDSTAMSAALHVHTTGLVAISGAQLLTGAAGTVGTTLAALTVDSGDPQHWFNDSIALSATDLANYNSGDWYANVFTAAQAGGELRGQLTSPAPTLTQLQATIFGPICSTCHTSGGDSPDLSTAALTYSSTVGVASAQQPAVLYIAAGDPDNSYLVLKIEGAASISGVRMPAGGPYLSQAMIDGVRAWVAAGAPNN
jgi:hypothetical protein